MTFGHNDFVMGGKASPESEERTRKRRAEREKAKAERKSLSGKSIT